MLRRRLREQHRIIDRNLTDEELIENAKTLGRLAEERDTMEKDKKAVLETFKGKLESNATATSALAKECRRGKRLEEMPVRVEFDQETGKLWYVVIATGEEVEGPLASPEDLQLIMPFGKPDETAEEGAKEE